MSGPGPCVVFALAKDAREAGLLSGADGRWVFLGKDVEERRRIEALFGSSRRYALAGKLHEVAARLRRPFLDFVSEVGALQRDAITWWSTAFAWKSGTVSDLFLLVCYLWVVRELIEKTRREGPSLLVIIEDPWLFRQIEEAFRGDDGVQFSGRAPLWPSKIRSVLLGVGKRTWWLTRVAGNHVWQRWMWGMRRVDVPERPAAALYSFPLERCLGGEGGWHDPFLPGMDSLLESLGYEVRWFSPPIASGLEREVAKRRRCFHPLILYAGATGVGRALRAFWWPTWPERLEVSGVPVRYLVQREWWEEIGRSGLCVYRLTYECLRNMLGAGTWKWIVFPFENQPWEKLLSLCAREAGVRTVGVQHAIFSVYSMPYFLGAGEADRMPLPDRICASGPYSLNLLAEGGIPQERLRMPGSVRFGHLGGNGSGEAAPAIVPAPLSEILVALPIDVHLARHLLAAVRAGFPSGGKEEGLRFHIKAHPMTPLDDEDIGFPAVRAPADFKKALELCGLVIYVGSTVGAEAAAMGRRVLRYRPELLLNVDPSEVYGDAIPTCSESDLRVAVLVQARNTAPVPHGAEENVRSCARQVFMPLDREALADVFRDPAPVGHTA